VGSSGGHDLVDAAALDIAVQRRRDQVVVGHPVALDLGALAERVGPLAPQLRVDAALRPTQLQGRHARAILLVPPDPEDDAVGEQRQHGGAAVGVDSLAEPDIPTSDFTGWIGLQLEAELGQPTFDHRVDRGDLELHPLDAARERVMTVGRHVHVVSQRGRGDNPMWPVGRRFRWTGAATMPANGGVEGGDGEHSGISS
jgi:hypothetical protein